jgi:hypothetical protein
MLSTSVAAADYRVTRDHGGFVEDYWFEKSGCCAIAAVQIAVRARHAAVTHDGVYENANKLTAL